MPIYEYKCETCETKFEKLIRTPDPQEPTCPSCGEQHVQRQQSTFAARANGIAPQQQPQGCGGGMCARPGGMCGMN